MNTNLSKSKILPWFLVVLWLCVIFWFSSQPGLKSALPSVWDYVFRKIAHMSEYFVLEYLFFRAFKNHKFILKKTLAFSVVASLFFASLDEIYQTTVPLRTGSIYDVLIDGVGIVICSLLLFFYSKKYEYLPDKQSF